VTVTPALAGLLAMASFAVALLAIPLLLDKGPVDRLQALERADSGPRRGGRGWVMRLVDWLAFRLGPRLAPTIRASKREAIGRRLDLAGRPGGITVQRFIGYKAAGLVLLGGLLFLMALGGGSILLAVLGGGIGWFAPDVLISRAGRLRQERIERDLPDFLDILAVTVRAGLGYRLSLARVSEALGGPVGEEMLVALRQMELGASRRSAFEALRERNASEQLSSFVAAQLQAEELGVPLSEALNDIATDMRRAAHQAARRRAARATPRVSLIVTSLIVPGTMILIFASIFLGSGLQDSGLF
jgi:tight adherence protein C